MTSQILRVLRACLAAVVTLAPIHDAGAQGFTGIRIERVEPGRWRATYRFSDPVSSLRFVRAAANHRERVWDIVTPGYRWESNRDAIRIRLREGASPAATIVFDIPEFTDPLPKEYELFQPFTDGDVALYTGHFHATPITASADDTLATLLAMHIVPPPGTHAIVRGRVDTGAVTVIDSTGEGTYVYLGTTRPIDTPHLTAIVDPGMPDWLREMFEQRLPELFAAYAKEFGVPLPWKPVVLYSFHDTASTGYSSGGGTLTGLINMTLTGSAWRTPSPDALVQAFYLLAHESAHLWNGQMVESAGGATSWMHEGSADAMANEMLLAFGLIDRREWLRRRENALNQCATQVRSASVHRAGERGAFKTFYDCGFVLALWTESAVRQQRPDATLFSFWRDLVAAARAQGDRYDEATWFDVMRSAGVADTVVAAMRSFLAANTIDTAVAGMRGAGMSIGSGAGPPPIAFQQTLARQAFSHVMGEACGRYSFNWGDPIVTVALPQCAPFSRSLRVHAVEGFRVSDQGLALYDAVAAACASGATVSVQGRDGTTLASIPCRERISARPVWYELRN